MVYRHLLQEIEGPEGADVWVVNDVDDTRLPTNFQFKPNFKFREGTGKLPDEAKYGCNCGPNNGQNIGCEYVQHCECLEDATDASGKRIGFPYSGTGRTKGCLRNKYLDTREPIYECNEKCNCGPLCKNRVVQQTRQIPLEIFRTSDGRGWGLRSPKPIMKGQFIDTYRGEVITDAEATRREKAVGRGKDSYLFSLDKFRNMVPDDELYVIDGETRGGPTRFMNHSCYPNCRQFAVIRYRGDPKLYELAFFALENIPAGTELTFDYVDNDQDDDEEDDLMEVDAAGIKQIEQERGKLATKCLCGASNCKKWLWI